MRTNLQRNPRVVRIASALHADRLRVIGGLHAVWSLADEQTEDGILDGYTFSVIDEMIGWPGFCQALSDVDWVKVNGKGIVFLRFEEHNGQSAKRRAQESDRKRTSRASAMDADKKRSREEKRREEKKQTTEEVALRLPEWLPLEAWKAWLEVRKSKKAPNTPRALSLALEELTRLRSLGFDAEKVLNESTIKGWRFVYPLKIELMATAAEPKGKLCDYCAKISTGMVNGRRSCDAHWDQAMGNVPPLKAVA